MAAPWQKQRKCDGPRAVRRASARLSCGAYESLQLSATRSGADWLCSMHHDTLTWRRCSAVWSRRNSKQSARSAHTASSSQKNPSLSPTKPGPGQAKAKPVLTDGSGGLTHSMYHHPSHYSMHHTSISARHPHLASFPTTSSATQGSRVSRRSGLLVVCSCWRFWERRWRGQG